MGEKMRERMSYEDTRCYERNTTRDERKKNFMR